MHVHLSVHMQMLCIISIIYIKIKFNSFRRVIA